MAKTTWLITECLRSAISALNEHAPLRRNVLGSVLFLTLLCIALAAFEIHRGGPAPRAYSPRLLAIVFLPAEFYIFDLCLGLAPRSGPAMYGDMRLLKLLWVGLLLCLIAAGVMAAIILPGAFILTLFKGLGTAAFIAIGLVAVIGITLAVLLAGFSVRFMFLPVSVALREPNPIRTLYQATKGKAWLLAKVLFWPYGALVAASVVMELIGPALERRLGFVALALWFLIDACLTALICCTSAVLLALVYRTFIDPPQPETGTAPMG
ncbi:MAG: hypothetical protein AUJ49_11975 [Desulfovibrionaceae bacterium CG1_02_65_16]|nr:MAG: hypothetical protein AUJ49_11975 [Desulfovibrionaceae bacterium CG1_02_65_16]